jgi:hypothetical protein
MSDLTKTTSASEAGVLHVEIKSAAEAGDDTILHGRPQEIRSRALAAALAAENPRPFRKSLLKLYMCLFFAYMCSSTTGFGRSSEDLALYFTDCFDRWQYFRVVGDDQMALMRQLIPSSGLSAEPDFKKYFNLTPANQGLTVAMYTIGQITACLVAGPIADIYGRR